MVISLEPLTGVGVAHGETEHDNSDGKQNHVQHVRSIFETARTQTAGPVELPMPCMRHLERRIPAPFRIGFRDGNSGGDIGIS